MIFSTIQLTLNRDGCALTNDKSINWHKGIIYIDWMFLTFLLPRTQDTEVLTYSWPHSLVTQSKWLDRKLSPSMSQDWEPIAWELREQTLNSRQYSINKVLLMVLQYIQCTGTVIQNLTFWWSRQITLSYSDQSAATLSDEMPSLITGCEDV